MQLSADHFAKTLLECHTFAATVNLSFICLPFEEDHDIKKLASTTRRSYDKAAVDLSRTN